MQICLKQQITNWSEAFLKPFSAAIFVGVSGSDFDCALPILLATHIWLFNSSICSLFLMMTVTTTSDLCKHPSLYCLGTFIKYINNRHLCYYGMHSRVSNLNSGYAPIHTHAHMHARTTHLLIVLQTANHGLCICLAKYF